MNQVAFNLFFDGAKTPKDTTQDLRTPRMSLHRSFTSTLWMLQIPSFSTYQKKIQQKKILRQIVKQQLKPAIK